MKNFLQKLAAYLILGAIAYCFMAVLNGELNFLNWSFAAKVIFIGCGAFLGLAVFEDEKIF